MNTADKKLLVIVTLVLLAFALFLHLDSIGLRAEEPRRAVLGMEAYLSGNILIPQIHGCPYYNKPPVFNWVLALFFTIFGSFEEWVVRLPGIISILLTGLFTFILVRKHIDTETGFFAAIFYITSADLFFYGSVNAAEIDLFYSFIVFLQVMSVFIFFNKRKYLLMFLISYLLAGLGILTKGLPSIAFQLITLLAVLLYYRKWRLLFSWKHLSGIVLFLVIVGGYFYIYSLKGNVYGFLINLIKESSQRTANEYPLSDILIRLLIFPFQLIKLTFPWILLLMFLFRKNFLKMVKTNRLILFSAIFIIPNIIIYWISPEIRDRYLYMFIPFVMIILAFFYTEYKDKNKKLNLWIMRIFGFIIILIMLFSATFPFIDKINSYTNNPVLISIIFFLIIGLLFAGYCRFREYRMYLFIIVLIVARIGFNFALLPHFQNISKTAKYINHVENIIEITKDEPIYYTGYIYTKTSDLSLFGYDIEKVTINTPPWLAYQIPYYIVKSNRHILKYEENIIPGQYYLAHEIFANDIDKTVYYRFRDKWTNREMILFRVEGEE